jgi:hypothetical protein
LRTHISVQIDEILNARPEGYAVAHQEGHQRVGIRDKIKSSFTKAKKTFKLVFNVIWKLQEFLLPMAASIPFVGAGVTLLSKSIELLVETTKNYYEIFTNVADLFEQIGFFSMRFDMVMEAQKAGTTVHPKFVREQHGRILAVLAGHLE